jgi:hypothetical protein
MGIAGLNTTFLQLTGDDYRKRLVWHAEQLRAVCGDPTDWANIHDACLLLTHQAGEWLTASATNVAGPEINPASRFAVHLFGHMHANDLSGVSKGGGPQRFSWQASSLFGMEKYGEPRLRCWPLGIWKIADHSSLLASHC